MDSEELSSRLSGGREESEDERGGRQAGRDWDGRRRSRLLPLPSPALFFLTLLLSLASTARARRLPDIYWNSSNPIFRVDNTDHVVGVKIRDRVNFVCPFRHPDSLFSQSELEYSEIYRVSKYGYDGCVLSRDSKLVGVCESPHERTRIGLVFREFTPIPGGLEYHPGRSYYFISTSNGSLSGMGNREGGLCARHNVRLKIEVLSPNPRPNAQDSWSVSSSGAAPPPAPSSLPPITPSPTPLMYIIHTRAPDEEADADQRPTRKDDAVVGENTVRVVDEGEEEVEDDGGGANALSPPRLLLFAASLLLIPANLIPQLWHS